MDTIITPFFEMQGFIGALPIQEERAEKIPKKAVKKIVKTFSGLPDPREPPKTKYPLEEILTIAFLAVLCGADDFVEFEAFGKRYRKWLKNFMRLECGIPSCRHFQKGVYDFGQKRA